LESTFALSSFFNSFGCSKISYESNNLIYNDFRFFYLFNTTLNDIKYYTSFIFLNINLRMESPVLNAKLRKLYLKSLKTLNTSFNVYSFGGNFNYSTFPVKNMGSRILVLKEFFEGKNIFSSVFSLNSLHLNLLGMNVNINNKLRLFMGSSLLNRLDFTSIYNGVLKSLFKLTNSNFFVSNLSFISTYLGYISSSEVVYKILLINILILVYLLLIF